MYRNQYYATLCLAAIVCVVTVSCKSGQMEVSESNTSPAPVMTLTAGFPVTSASAITNPPSSMDGINTQVHLFGTGADPEMITLGPVKSSQPNLQAYPGKHSLDFIIHSNAPILAPVDMVLIGFDNRNAVNRAFPDGSRSMPFDDLEVCFESVSDDWPGMIVCAYHLSTSPLLTGHNVNESCSFVEEWVGTWQTEGRIFYEYSERMSPLSEEAKPCGALLGRLVKGGDVIGYTGNVNNSPLVAFRFKVPAAIENPIVQQGDRNLHWVQPDSFFYWACYSLETNFPSGILNYPFECGGFQLSDKKQNVEFKFSTLD